MEIKPKLLAFHLCLKIELHNFVSGMHHSHNGDKYCSGLCKGIIDHNNTHSVLIFSGTRLNAEKIDLSAILPEEVEEEVKAAAEISMGTEVF